MELPGLMRLLEVCQRLALGLLIQPPSRPSPMAGTLVGGLPFDPLLAAFYSRWGQASFATDAAGVILARNDDSEFGLEQDNARWRANYQERVPLSLFLFAGEPLLAYSYATVPGLADAQGLQPVVHVDMYEFDGPVILPIASNVDRFFDTYSRFLEEAAATPEFQKAREVPLTFPWDVPHILARDTRLVELIRAGRFDTAMPRDDSTRQWLAAVLGSSS